MSLFHNPSIVTNGMILNVDAANVRSYSGSGTNWFDLSGQNNTGVLTNGPTYSSANGGYIALDGVNDCVLINSNASIMSNSTYTKLAWCYFTSFGTGNNIISGGNLGTNHALFLAQTNIVYAGHNGSWFTVQSTSTLSLNTWYYIGVTFSSATGWIIYINGSASGTSANTTQFTAGQGEILLGAYGTGTNVLTGRIANASVYNRVLSAAEVSQNFNALRARFGV